MRLEFELDEPLVSARYMQYVVKRKGLEVGYLFLVKEPYGEKKALVKNMACE